MRDEGAKTNWHSSSGKRKIFLLPKIRSKHRGICRGVKGVRRFRRKDTKREVAVSGN